MQVVKEASKLIKHAIRVARGDGHASTGSHSDGLYEP